MNKIKAGDTVAFNTLPDAVWFEVRAVNGFMLTVREYGTEYAEQHMDYSLVKQVNPTTYRLGSSGLVYAPGVIAWAINGYAFSRDRRHLRKMIAETWSIPEAAAVALLSKAVTYTIEDEAVVFTHGEPA